MKLLPVTTVENKKVGALNLINFNASITKSAVSKVDKLILSTKDAERLAKIKALYSKVQTSLPQIKPKTIEAIIARLSEYPREDVLAVMDRLTAFSNMRSFIGLRKYFHEQSILKFSTFQKSYDYSPKYKSVETSDNQYKFHALADAFKRNRPVLLNHIVHYIFTTPTAKSPLRMGVNNGIVLDENTLDLLENVKKSDRELFNRYLSENKIFLIKDFENTYNIFSQDVDFEDLVRKNLEK